MTNSLVVTKGLFTDLPNGGRSRIACVCFGPHTQSPISKRSLIMALVD
jgi:hypothetical protein